MHASVVVSMFEHAVMEVVCVNGQAWLLRTAGRKIAPGNNKHLGLLMPHSPSCWGLQQWLWWIVNLFEAREGYFLTLTATAPGIMATDRPGAQQMPKCPGVPPSWRHSLQNLAVQQAAICLWARRLLLPGAG